MGRGASKTSRHTSGAISVLATFLHAPACRAEARKPIITPCASERATVTARDSHLAHAHGRRCHQVAATTWAIQVGQRPRWSCSMSCLDEESTPSCKQISSHRSNVRAWLLFTEAATHLGWRLESSPPPTCTHFALLRRKRAIATTRGESASRAPFCCCCCRASGEAPCWRSCVGECQERLNGPT